MRKTLGPAPGTKRHPDHVVAISSNAGQWSAVVNGQQVASSADTLAVDETNYDRVIYFPQGDVRADLLGSSDSRSTCPFKGEARYFSATVNGAQQDVAWYYPEVYDEIESLAGYVAFYADRVDVRESEL